MPVDGPFSLAGALLLLSLAVLTIFWPLRSVMLFTLLASFASVAEELGWDPRLYWGLMLAARALWDWAYGPRRRRFVSRNTLLVWLLFCLVSVCVLYGDTTGLTSEDEATALSLFFYSMAGSMFLLAVTQFAVTGRQLTTLLGCFAGAAVTVSLYAAGQALIAYRAGSAERVSATLGNPNYLSTNLALASTSLLLAARRQRNRQAIFFRVGAVLCLIGTVLTLSRAGIASAMVGWALVYVTRTGRLEYRKAVLIFSVSALIAGVGVGSYLFNYRQEITYSDDPRKADLAVVVQAAEDLSRLEAALYAVQLIGEHPVLGSGFGTFAARNYNANGSYVATHDTWLELFTGTGAVGTFLLGALIFILARRLRKPGRILYLPVAGCFLVSSLFGDYLQSIDVLVILSVMYVFACHSIESDLLPAAKAAEV
jgi:hypothetical protein